MPAPPLGPGAILAQRYDILRRIDGGGMGDVYEAHDRTLGIKGALKIMKGSAPDADARARFRSEVVLARQVRHKNVCAIHDYGTDGERDFISMELVEGQDLRHLIQEQGPLDWDRAYEVALQVCDGLAAIHEAGIIHRDLKPANLMLAPNGLVKVMDFGVAKVGSALAQSHTQTGMVVGTPEYMSPEQVRGGEIDFRSDLYALGVVIFEMFTGRVPFRADTPVGTMLLHLEEPVPLDPAPDRLPGPLVAVLQRALAKRSVERFASAAEMREALAEARSSTRGTDPVPVVIRDVGSGERPTELPRKPASLRPSATLPPEARLLLPMLARALKNPQGDIRLQAARAIALHGRSAALAIPSLQALATDPLPEVRETVALALHQIGPPGEAAPAVPDAPELRPSDKDARVRRPEVRAGPPSEPSRDRATQGELEAPVPARGATPPAPPPPAAKEEPASAEIVPSRPAPPPPAVPRPAPPPVSASPPGPEPASERIPVPVPKPARPGPPRRAEPAPAPGEPLWRHPFVLALVVASAVFGLGGILLKECRPAVDSPSGTTAPTPVTSGEGFRGDTTTTTTLPHTTTLPPTTTTPATTLPPPPTPTVPGRPSGGSALPGSTTPTTTATTTTTEPTTTTTSTTTTTTSTTTTTTMPRPVQWDHPECEKCPQVPYPDIAAVAGAEGRVELRLLVDERGAVTILESTYRPLPSHRATGAGLQKVLVEAASAGVKKWVYRPGRRDGAPFRMEARAVVEFRLTP